MKRPMKQAVALAAAALLALSVAGCSEKTDPASAASSQGEEKKGTVVVYTSESQDLVTDMLEDFKAKTGYDYSLFRSGSGDVIAKLNAELQTGSTEADILWVADIGYMYQLDEQGLIEHYTPAGADQIDSKFNYNDSMAFEVRQIFNIIATNTLKNTAEIGDWYDLCDPALSGKIAMANPSYSGGAFTTLVAHVNNEQLGWQYYEDLKANDIKFEQSNGNLQTKISSGEYTAVSVVDFMIRNAQNEGAPVEIVWPESGAVMVPTPVAMLSTVAEEDREACHALMDYMLSEDGQKFFVEQGYIPVSEEVGVPEGAPNVNEIKVMDMALDSFINDSAAIREQFETIFTAN